MSESDQSKQGSHDRPFSRESYTSGSFLLQGFPPNLTTTDVLQFLKSKYDIPAKQLKVSIGQNRTATLKVLSGEAYQILASQKQIVIAGYTLTVERVRKPQSRAVVVEDEFENDNLGSIDNTHRPDEEYRDEYPVMPKTKRYKENVIPSSHPRALPEAPSFSELEGDDQYDWIEPPRLPPYENFDENVDENFDENVDENFDENVDENFSPIGNSHALPEHSINAQPNQREREFARNNELSATSTSAQPNRNVTPTRDPRAFPSHSNAQPRGQQDREYNGNTGGKISKKANTGQYEEKTAAPSDPRAYHKKSTYVQSNERDVASGCHTSSEFSRKPSVRQYDPEPALGRQQSRKDSPSRPVLYSKLRQIRNCNSPSNGAHDTPNNMKNHLDSNRPFRDVNHPSNDTTPVNEHTEPYRQSQNFNYSGNDGRDIPTSMNDHLPPSQQFRDFNHPNNDTTAPINENAEPYRQSQNFNYSGNDAHDIPTPMNDHLPSNRQFRDFSHPGNGAHDTTSPLKEPYRQFRNSNHSSNNTHDTISSMNDHLDSNRQSRNFNHPSNDTTAPISELTEPYRQSQNFNYSGKDGRNIPTPMNDHLPPNRQFRDFNHPSNDTTALNEHAEPYRQSQNFNYSGNDGRNIPTPMNDHLPPNRQFRDFNHPSNDTTALNEHAEPYRQSQNFNYSGNDAHDDIPTPMNDHLPSNRQFRDFSHPGNGAHDTTSPLKEPYRQFRNSNHSSNNTHDTTSSVNDHLDSNRQFRNFNHPGNDARDTNEYMEPQNFNYSSDDAYDTPTSVNDHPDPHRQSRNFNYPRNDSPTFMEDHLDVKPRRQPPQGRTRRHNNTRGRSTLTKDQLDPTSQHQQPRGRNHHNIDAYDQEARGRPRNSRFHQARDELAEGMEFDIRSSSPKNYKSSAVFLLGVPLRIKEADIISKLNDIFGTVLSCKIGRLTRICKVEFDDPEDAKSALVAQCVSLRLGDDASTQNDNFVAVKIKKEASTTLFVQGEVGNLDLVELQSHLVQVFKGDMKIQNDKKMNGVLAFECDYEFAEKALLMERIFYKQEYLKFYAEIGIIYLEELPPTATKEKITDALRLLVRRLVEVHIVISATEGTAAVMLADSLLKDQLLAHKVVDIDNKPVRIFREALPKVYMEGIPQVLFQQPEEDLLQAIKALQVFEGMLTYVELRRTEKMAVLSLKNNEVRSRVLRQCSIYAPLLQGHTVRICAMRAMPAIWEFDDKWYKLAEEQELIDQYDLDNSVFLREWRPEIWTRWMTNYQEMQKKANSKNNSDDMARASKQIHGMRVTAMLSTLSAIRNEFYCLPGEPNVKIKISPPREPSEQFTFAALPPASLTGYDRTSISVIKRDCLLAALDMKGRGLRPVVLNMASAKSPGGGYRRGDGAQEENLFRRSNYLSSLDDPSNPRCPKYPISEFGGIYTPDITVFRDSEDLGYAFRQPFKVDFIAVAAYRKPTVQDNCLLPQIAAQTRRKIEAIFAIALHKGHDSLLLSALGCGAYQNPPDHIAAIFLAVAQQYSRKFKEIVYAIVEDHNSGNSLNPNGNYEPFHWRLDCANLGPGYTSLPQVTAPRVSTCIHGGRCDIIDAAHTRDFYHPPFCPFGRECQSSDDHHTFLFCHVQTCKDMGHCTKFDDAGHTSLFTHPPHCSKRGECSLVDDKHLRKYLHMPLCAQGMLCLDRTTTPHSENFRHIKDKCPDGKFCGHYMVVTHVNQYTHPFNTPCPDTPFACTNTDLEHLAKFAHVCSNGAECSKLTDSEHLRSAIHVRRTPCSDGDHCKQLLNEEHLNLFSHPKVKDIRLPCKYGQGCTKRDHRNHVAEYAHQPEGPPISNYEETPQSVNFSKNAQDMLKATGDYFEKQGKNFVVPDEVIEWVRRLCPAHRVRPKVFQSILAHHHVMSSDHIQKLKNPQWAALEARHHPLVKKICRENELGEIEKNHLEGLLECAVLVAYGKMASPPDAQLPTWEKNFSLKKDAVFTFLTSDQMQPLIDLGDRLVTATAALVAEPGGINYEVDKKVGTNKHVFSILGPHTGYYYGDVILLFKQDIMHHPQFNFTTNSATSFYSGKESKNRPYTKDVKHDEAVAKFHSSKLHPMCKDWVKAAAADICAQVMAATQKTQVTLKDVTEYWMREDSHFVFEAHLPSLIPFSFVSKIIIPKNIWEHLSDNDKEELKLAFPDDKDPKVICDPVGDDFNAASISSTPERTRLTQSVMEHFLVPTTAKNVPRPLGMSVSLERGAGDILSLPVQFPIAGEGNIYFRAKGSEFFITLAENQTRQNNNNNERLTFYFGGPKVHRLYITEMAPTAHRMTLDRKNWLAQDPDFDKGFREGDWVNYHIEISSKTKTCSVEHWGFSQIYNRRTVHVDADTISRRFDLSAVQWMGIGAWKSQVSFESIEVYRKPLQETSSLQAMPRLAATTQKRLFDLFSRFTGSSPRTGGPTKTEEPSTETTDGEKMPGGYEDNREPCSYGTICSKYDKPDHFQKFAHPFVTPCHDMSACKLQFKLQHSPHNKEFSHLCRFGGNCRQLNIAEHQRYFIHKILPKCSEDGSCTQMADWKHRESFQHERVPCILIPCIHGLRCTMMGEESHFRVYKHVHEYGE